ncbi:MAG: hypothetical protein ACFFDW_03005 [Candidatus Thorarchaeota archaeon]
MDLTSKNIILILRSLGENLILGRSFESSLFFSIKSLPEKFKEKEQLLNMINLGYDKNQIFIKLISFTRDKSLSRIWILIMKLSKLSNLETGEKILEIVENLEQNRLLEEKTNSILKAQRYKVLFLGTITSLFLGIIAGLAPLFISFIQIFRNLTFSQGTLIMIPISLYIIAESSIYFLSDIGSSKFNYKTILFSTIAYLVTFLISKGVLNLILQN